MFHMKHRDAQLGGAKRAGLAPERKRAARMCERARNAQARKSSRAHGPQRQHEKRNANEQGATMAKDIPYDQKYYDPEIECMPRPELEALQLEIGRAHV